MLTCEHRSQTNRQWRILPPDDSPTQSCAMTGPLSEKWECCRTQTDTIIDENIALIHPGCENAAWENELKIESYTR